MFPLFKHQNSSARKHDCRHVYKHSFIKMAGIPGWNLVLVPVDMHQREPVLLLTARWRYVSSQQVSVAPFPVDVT